MTCKSDRVPAELDSDRYEPFRLSNVSNVELRARWFKPPSPADTIVRVAGLTLSGLELEIGAVAP